MKILLDTCTFLWLISDAQELTEAGKALFSNAENDVFLSVASTWEIVVKYKLGKLPLPCPPQQFIHLNRTRHHIESLPMDEASVFQLARLPDYHTDPFDRMIICQAIAHGLVILTPDAHISQYPVRTEW